MQQDPRIQLRPRVHGVFDHPATSTCTQLSEGMLSIEIHMCPSLHLEGKNPNRVLEIWVTGFSQPSESSAPVHQDQISVLARFELAILFYSHGTST